MELTKQEIARVFAMYCPSDEKIFINPETGISYHGTLYQLSSMRGFLHEYKLRLIPLSNITDERRLAISKLMNFDIISFSDTGFTVKIENVTRYPFNKEFEIECIHYVAADQLREWGYALPYKGKSLFDLEIAISQPH